MRYMKYFALLVVLMLPLAYSQAQVRIGVGIGVAPGYADGPPVCQYGYYDYYPYACAPYGFYGPEYFAGGFFIGAGPWYHWGHPAEFWGRPGWGRGGWDRDDRGRWGREGHDGWGRGESARPSAGFGRGGQAHGFAGSGGFYGGGPRGSAGFHGGGFHGGGHR
jgi:hypothetical protein